jgi:uncharacterized protein
MMRRTIITLVAMLATAITNRSYGQEPTRSVPTTKPKGTSLDERLLFFPSKYPSGDWNPTQLDFEDVYFTAADGTKLHGWYCPAKERRAVVLIAHGNAGHVASRAPWLLYLQKSSHVSVFMFDYRGYGRSEGAPTVAGAIEDAIAAREKLCELADVKNSEIFIMGESLGGAIAVQLAAESAPRGLILQSTFSSLRDVAAVHYPKLAWLVPKHKLDSGSRIGQYHGPLLQSHGSKDSTIPVALGEKLFQAANEPKQFVKIEDVDHNNWLTESYLRQLDAFFVRVTSAEN